MLEKLAIRLIAGYQRYIRIMLPDSCRFIPSCSEYARQAILKYGFFPGTLKGIRRVLLCHPFSRKIGDDPLI